ncbi:MAG: dihydroorotate dehydrogenase, partial [Clostridiales bacterium]|nr:dihydroorotate dehydrogenase [Clostridiales bacterium]
DICGMRLKNPVIAASGTFGFGEEYGEYVDLDRLGGISVKGLTLKARKGNPPPRLAETPAGLLNSVGLQNPGVEAFAQRELPRLLRHGGLAVIANVAGSSKEDYREMARILSETPVHAIELNVSCPNVKEGGISFGATKSGLAEIVSFVRPFCKKPLIVKLTPNVGVGGVGALARVAEREGADAVSLINTLLGMKIDIYAKRPVLRNNTGGLSGPAVMPVAVRMAWEAASSVGIPVIGMGGISSGADAVEFMLAGASAVMVGTASFADPAACIEVASGIEAYCRACGHRSAREIVGALRAWQ